MIYIHDIELNGDDEFSRKFNYISWLWKMAINESLPKEKQDFYMNEHFTAKYCLEQGIEVSFLNEYLNYQNNNK